MQVAQVQQLSEEQVTFSEPMGLGQSGSSIEVCRQSTIGVD